MGLGRIIQKLKLRYGSHETRIAVFRALGMRIGERCRIYTDRIGSEPWLIRIGNHVDIAPNVTFVTHSANTVLQDKYASLTDFGKIDIRDNCFIAVNATILPNVAIGPNSVVAACSVVTRDVPPDTVVAGNPARPICTLEEYEARVVKRHLDIPKDREAARAFLERHFWGDGA